MRVSRAFTRHREEKGRVLTCGQLATILLLFTSAFYNLYLLQAARTQVAQSDRADSPSSSETDTLVTYVFRNTNPESVNNLIYFLEHGIKENDGARYIIAMDPALQELETPQLPAVPGNAEFIRPPACFEMGVVGWLLYTSGKVQINKYRYFVWVSSQVRGPFLPVYHRSSSSWHSLLTERLGSVTKLVGSTISCSAFIFDKAQQPVDHPHIQNYVIATDAVGLKLLKSVGALDCHNNWFDNQRFAEFGASGAVLKAGYNIESLMLRYEGLDWRDQSKWSCNARIDPLHQNSYDGTAVNPLEVMFVRTEFSSLVVGIPHVAQAVLYSDWASARGRQGGQNVSSNAWIRVAAKTRQSVMSRPQACFDTEFYAMASPVEFEGFTPEELYEHFKVFGFREGRPFNFIMDDSEAKLNSFGYRQELQRVLSQFGNLAVTLSVTSSLFSITSSFQVGYSHGGPALMVWGWVGHTILGLTVPLSLAELCSAVPLTGSVFTWSYFFGGRHGRFWCWVTGWLVLVSWIAGTASAAFLCCYLISTSTIINQGGIGEGGVLFTPAQLYGIAAAVLVSQGLLNLLPLRILALFNKFATFLNFAGSVTFIILLPSAAVTRQSADFVFTHFDKTSYGYVKGVGYTAVIGFLFAVYALAGFDSGTHMAEETSFASLAVARNLYLSFLCNAVLGFGLLLAILFSMQVTSADALASGPAGGLIIAQIFWDIFQARYGSGSKALGILCIITIAVYLGGLGSMTVASRVLWAFSRDGALPFSPLWRNVNRSSGTPMNAVFTTAVLCLLISLPLLKSEVAFSACISVVILGGAASFLICIGLKAFVTGRNFVPGPLSFGRLSLPLNLVALAYILLVCGAACMPTEYPITETNLNYAPIAFGAVVVAALLFWWLPKFGAQHRFALGRASLDLESSKSSAPSSPKAFAMEHSTDKLS